LGPRGGSRRGREHGGGGHGDGEARRQRSGGPRHSSVTSTRRFFARPSFVELSAIRFGPPPPLVLIPAGSIPPAFLYSRSALARRSVSCWLYTSEQAQSVWPSTSARICRCSFNGSTISSSMRCSPAGLSVALSKSK